MIDKLLVTKKLNELKNNLSDFEDFISYIKEFLEE
jgi:hypothetical protein